MSKISDPQPPRASTERVVLKVMLYIGLVGSLLSVGPMGVGLAGICTALFLCTLAVLAHFPARGG